MGVGSIFEAGVFVRTEGQIVNAIEGRITFPSDLLQLKEIREGNSVLSLWIQRPEADGHTQEPGEIFFSGLVPGGFTGEDGYLFSLFFEAVLPGEARIATDSEQILLADGKGSKTVVKRSPLVFDITRETKAVNELASLEDSIPPEPFSLTIGRDPSIFGGKWFVAFAAQDKGFGIASYAIHESPRIQARIEAKDWIKAESPYLLQDQSLRSYIYVKAVDKAGNERIETLEPQKPKKWYESYAVWIIIIGIVVLAGLFGRVLWRRRYTKNHE